MLDAFSPAPFPLVAALFPLVTALFPLVPAIYLQAQLYAIFVSPQYAY